MGFLDRAKAAANDLISTVDQQLGSVEGRDAEKHYRDLGMLAYLVETDRPIDEADRQRILGVLKSLDERGQLPPFRLVTAMAPEAVIPPPPGANAQTPPAPAPGTTPPAEAAGSAPLTPPAAEPAYGDSGQGTASAPPPPPPPPPPPGN